jgi:hypothetical protein
MNEAQSLGTPPKREKIPDRTLSTVLSLYISSERMQETFSNWGREKRAEIQGGYEDTKELREAIDPLFNDVAMRDRNSTLDEFLIDVQGHRVVETITITVPEEFQWRTEGKSSWVDLGGPTSHPLQCQMFWYVHSNGALSYHIAFRLNYDHNFADYYFLSILQKLFFPKEFYPEDVERPCKIHTGKTGLWVLDREMITAPIDYLKSQDDTHELTFWAYVRDRFCRQLRALISKKKIELRDRQPASTAHDVWHFLWTMLIEQDEVPVIEVPGLTAPVVRSLFLFKDRELWKILQSQERESVVGNPNYAASDEDDADVEIIRADDFDKPRDPTKPFDPRYFFLSGFFQNIIDFRNQDASEVLDGTDPIYPSTEIQRKESFFLCYANSRSLFEVVENSRSLAAGAPYIGICPYLFLIHLMALHNEFVILRYEKETKEIQDAFDSQDLQPLFRSGGASAETLEKINEVTSRFYAFRYRAFTVFTRHLYDNVFRYDTERDIFAELLRIRGITGRFERCRSIVEGLDKTMQDLEEDKRYHDENIGRTADRRLQYGVALVSIFSVMQAAFQAAEVYRALFVKPPETIATAPPPKCSFVELPRLISCSDLSSADWFAICIFLLPLVLAITAVPWLAYRAGKRLFNGMKRSHRNVVPN